MQLLKYIDNQGLPALVPATAFALADIDVEEAGNAVLRVHFRGPISLSPVHLEYNSETAAREALRILSKRLGGDSKVDLDKLENNGEAPTPSTIARVR